MSDWLDTPGEIAALVSITGVFLAGLIWLIRAVVVMGKQFEPNGGSSARDQLDRIERKVDAHIEWHMNQKGN